MQPKYTRGRKVEFMARDLLQSRGYHVIRSAGSHSPVDLVAWRKQEDILVVQVKRIRTPLSNPFRVARLYRRDIQVLQQMHRPNHTRVQLWLYTDHSGWRFYHILTGGITEVADYVV